MHSLDFMPILNPGPLSHDKQTGPRLKDFPDKDM